MMKFITDTEWVNQNEMNFDLNRLFNNNIQLMNTTDYIFICDIAKKLLKPLKKQYVASIDKGKLLVNYDTYSVYIDTRINHNIPIYLNNSNIKLIRKLFNATQLIAFKLSGTSYSIEGYKSEKNNLVRFKYHNTLIIDYIEKPKTSRIEIPKKAEKLSSLDISERIQDLMQSKNLFKTEEYHVLIDKQTYEVLSISTQNDKNFHKETFIDKTKEYPKNDNYLFAKVTELAPVNYKRKMTILLNIYKDKSDTYIETITSFEENKKKYSYILTTKVDFTISSNKNLIKENYDSEQSTSKTLNSKWDITTKLNKFKFTIHTEDNSFISKLKNILHTLSIIQVEKNDKIKEYSFGIQPDSKKYKNIVKIHLKNTFLKLKITNKFDYTFTFVDLINFENQFPPIDNIEINITYEKRLEILSQLLKFIKGENLYEKTKIKSIGFANVFYEKKYFDKIKLVKFNTAPNKVPYICYDYINTKNVYSILHYYKVYLKE